LKGEITVLVARGESTASDPTPLEAAVEKLMQAGVPRMEALKTIARERGLSKRDVYKKLLDAE
jgi:16S rRNA (cytidine1402-2'-O)-methyltransferase